MAVNPLIEPMVNPSPNPNAGTDVIDYPVKTSGGIHPLITPATAQDPYSALGPIDYPVKANGAQKAWAQTAHIEPDHAAEVLKTSKALGENPAFIANNLDKAKQAAAMPEASYFANLEKQYPITHAYVSDPEKMATAKDDMDNLGLFEKTAKEAIRAAAQFAPGMFEKGLAEKTPAMMGALDEGWQAEKAAMKAGQLQEQLHFLGYGKITGQNIDAGSFTGQIWNKIIGLGAGQNPDERINDIQNQLKELEKYRPSLKNPLGRGIYGATEFVPWMTGSATRGGEFALGGAAVGALAGLETGPGAAGTALAGGMALFPVGEAEYNFKRMAGMMRIQMDQVHDENGQPLPENIKNIASLAAGAGGAGLGMIRLGAVLKTIPGGEAFLKGFQSKAGEAILNPATYKSALVDYTKQWLSSTAHAAGAMGALSALNIGLEQAAQGVSGQPFAPFSLHQAIGEVGSSIGEGALTFGVLGAPGTLLGMYSKMGDIARESKLAKRLPEAHQEFTDSITKGSPIESIGIPAEKFATYFQDKKLDPMSVAKELGVDTQFQTARDSGGDLNIPYSTWLSKTVGTGHYEGLKDDIRFRPEDPTVNEARERADTIGKEMQAEVDQAAKANPGWAEGRQKVMDDMQGQLQATGVYNEKVTKSQAELATKVIERMAARYGAADPAEWLKRNPIRIVNGQMEAQEPPTREALAAQALRQGSLSDQELDKAFGGIVDEVATGKRMPSQSIPTGRTSEILKFVGAKDLPMVMPPSVIEKARTKHQISVDNIKRMPEELRDPMMVFTGSQAKSIDVLTQLKNAEGKPVTVAIHLERTENRYEVNRIATLSERNVGEIGKRIDRGDLRYWDQERAMPWLQSAGLAVATGEGDKALKTPSLRSSGLDEAPTVGAKESTQRVLSKADFVNSLKGPETQFQGGRQELPVKEPGSKTGPAHALFAYNDQFGEGGKERSLYNVYGDPADPKIKERGWGSSVEKADLDKAGILIVGREAKSAKYEPLDFKKEPALFQSAFHGSPYDFDQFKLNKIGTGEGAASYGWGLYFAGKKEVAEYYKEGLSRNSYEVNGKIRQSRPWADFEKGAQGVVLTPEDYAVKAVHSTDSPKAELERAAEGKNPHLPDKKLAKAALPLLDSVKESKGRVYKVDIPDDKEFLDYDKPIKEQPAIEKLFPPEEARKLIKEWEKGSGEKFQEVSSSKPQNFYDMTGKELYGTLADIASYKGVKDYGEQSKVASERLRSLGIPGLRYLDQGSRSAAEGSHNYVLFDDSRIKILQKFHQGDPETDPRGFIKFTPKETLISLVKGKADESTFPHELAHYWLKNFHEFIQAGQGTEQHQADWKILSDWLKVEEGQKDLKMEQQEKFARGFEAYLREGKAPSEDLRGVFAKFHRWLTRLYRDPATLGVELNDNVRGVMDRMLASDEEIAFAERNAGRDAQAQIDIPGLDPALKGKLEKLRDQAHEEAVRELLKPQMAEITDEHKAFLLKERANAEQKASDAVAESQELKAMDSIKELFKKDAKTVAASWLGKTMKEGDQDVFESAASKEGYGSGDEMAKKIMDTPDRAAQIKGLADQEMAKHAGLKDRGSIKEEALNAIHNEKEAELLANEESIFRMKVAEAQGRRFNAEQHARLAKLETMAAGIRARETIGSKSVADAGKFMPYFTAERNAALKVQKALQDGDWQQAADAKRQQLLNHALVRESYAARQEIQKTMAFFDRFASRKQDLKDMPYGFIRQIDTLLSDRGLASARDEDGKTYLKIAQDMAAKGADSDEIAHATGWMPDGKNGWKPEALADTVARIQNDYRNVAVPESVLTTKPADYRSMPMQDFRDLKQAVQSINAVGRGYDNFLDENIKMDRKEAAAKLKEFITQNIGQKYAEGKLIGSKSGQNIVTQKIGTLLDLPNAAIPSLVNLLRICDFLDAGKADGLMKNLVYRPLLHGDQNEIKMTREAVKDMNAIHDRIWDKGEFEKLRNEKVYIKSLDRNMTRDEIQAVAFNWGNETNKKRVIDGYQLTGEQQREILSNVDKKMWDFAQAVWDHHDKYWPQIVANQQKVSGETPGRVTPSEVSTPYGNYRGGYYPLSYDYQRSDSAYNNVEARNALYKTAGAVAAHTEHGFTAARVASFTGPVRLDTHVAYMHLQDVIHDLAYRPAVIDVNGFLRQRDVREAISNAIGQDGLRTIQQHLKWVASDQGEYLTAADKMLRYVRFGATIATLGFRPMTAPIFLVSNAISAIKDIGPVGFGNAVKDFLSDRDANVQLVNSLSERMAKRSTLRDRDLMDMAKTHEGEESLLQHFAFYPHNKADQAITYPLWLQVYRGNLSEFGSQKAVDIADEAVTKLAGSGSMLDQSMIQRGSEGKKIFTWWYSWAGTQFNRMWADGKLAGLEYDKGNVGTALTVLATSAFYGWALQGANENLWREFFHNTQSPDEDKRKKRMAEREIMQGISYVPIFRELAQYGLGKMMGGQAEYELPFQEAVKTVINPLADMARAGLTDKSLSPRFWENTAKEAAIGLKYPQYLNTLAFNFLDYLNGQGELTWRDLLARRTKS